MKTIAALAAAVLVCIAITRVTSMTVGNPYVQTAAAAAAAADSQPLYGKCVCGTS